MHMQDDCRNPCSSPGWALSEQHDDAFITYELTKGNIKPLSYWRFSSKTAG